MRKGDIWKDPRDGELVEILEDNLWSYTFLNGERKGYLLEYSNNPPDYATVFVGRKESYIITEILSRYDS